MIHKILVPDMHCEHCVKRIDNALKETGINYTINLDSQTVTVDGCEKCLSTALNEIYDLGFTPEVK